MAKTERAVRAARLKPSPAPKLAPIQEVEQKSARDFNAEGGKQITVPFKGNDIHAKSAQPVAKVAKRLRTEYRQAKKEVASSGGHLTGDLGPEQRKFVRGVAKATHLKSRTIAAQARAEEGNAAQTEAEETHNFLNMGPGIRYSSLKEGVRETAHNYNTAPYYEGVRATRGAPAKVQVDAIGASPWGTDPTLIKQTLGEVGFKGKPNPRAERKLARVKAEAKEKGVPLPSKAGPPPKQVVSRYKAGRAAMEQLDRRNQRGEQPYVWAGGHGSNPIGGADCSGAVSYALDKMGVLKGSLVSGDMGQVLKPGPGAITVFYNSVHTFIYDSVKGEYWGTSNSNSGGGAGYFPKSVGDAEVASGNSGGAYSVGHVPGLGRKQALQLGGAAPGVSGSASFPGMTLSSSGTSATIDSGAGATVSKPGFSKSPIRLTAQQRYRRTARRLKEVGVGEAASTKPEVSPTLQRLEKKYSVAG